jgi:hypothetical protein
MPFKRKNDNIYEVGTVVTPRQDLNRKLVIMRYIHRTYYCAAVGDATSSILKYTESDLRLSSQEHEMAVMAT